VKKLLLGLALTIFTFGVANAGSTLNFAWEYPYIPADLAGFKMYKKGTTGSVKTVGKEARTLTYISDDDTKQCYTLTAFDPTSESGQTPEVCLDPPPPVPAGFKVVITVSVVEN